MNLRHDNSPWAIAGIDARLRELHGDKLLSMREIADRISFEFEVGISRNAIIGRARRIGLPKRPAGTSRSPTIAPKRKPPVRVDAPIAPTIEPVAEPGLAVAMPLPPGLTIYQLREGVCKFPLGGAYDRPPYFYCGKATKFDRSWCHEHFRRVHNNPPRQVAP